MLSQVECSRRIGLVDAIGVVAVVVVVVNQNTATQLLVLEFSKQLRYFFTNKTYIKSRHEKDPLLSSLMRRAL
jgi:hypothetical protein